MRKYQEEINNINEIKYNLELKIDQKNKQILE